MADDPPALGFCVVCEVVIFQNVVWMEKRIIHFTRYIFDSKKGVDELKVFLLLFCKMYNFDKFF